MKTHSYLAALLVASLAALSWQSTALAALGADVPSITVDQQQMHGAVIRFTPMQHFDVHEITTSGGTSVREYATPQGKVFAVTWRGPFPPNLQQLFGSYYAQYQAGAAAASQEHTGMHRMLAVKQSDFVMQATGRLRAYHGKAYVPSLVPAGVSIADLQ